MSYELKLDDVFELKDGSYIIIDKLVYKDTNYYFTNKLLNEDEPGKEFFVFKGVSNGIVKEKDKEILDYVLKVFSKNMNDKIEYLNNYNTEDGE